MHIQKILALCCFVCIFIVPGTIAESPPVTEPGFVNIEEQTISPGLFEIKIVDPLLLESVKQNYGSRAIPLKVEKGLYIGVLTPNALYIRGDLNEHDFPVRDILQVNMEDKVAKHLIDITFGRDNVKTELFGKEKKYKIWLKAMYYNTDVETLRDFVVLFNDLSQTTSFDDEEIALPSYHPNYNPDPYQYYTISFIDKDLFKEKYDDRNSAQDQIVKDKTGKPIAIVRTDNAYILQDLKGAERAHYLLRCLLFSMGFHGESSDSDSFFNPSNTAQTTLSDLDTQAVQLMYGGRLQTGLTLDEVKKTLGVTSKT